MAFAEVTLELEPDAEAARCRAALYEALALGFRPPAPGMIRRLAIPEGAAALAAAADTLGDGLGPLVRRLAEIDTELRTLAASYHRLFIEHRQLENEAADGSEGNRGTRAAAECERLAYLARKEAHALERGDPVLLRETRRAEHTVLRDHAGHYLPVIAAHLACVDPSGFYGALGALAAAFVREECTWLEVAAGPPSIRVCLPRGDDAPIARGGTPLSPPGHVVADGD